MRMHRRVVAVLVSEVDVVAAVGGHRWIGDARIRVGDDRVRERAAVVLGDGHALVLVRIATGILWHEHGAVGRYADMAVDGLTRGTGAEEVRRGVPGEPSVRA